MASVDIDGRSYEQHDLLCPDCGDHMELRRDGFGVRYRCTAAGCRGAHGAHPSGAPHGVPADARTRRARSEAHEVFDRTWRTGRMSRTEAYAWMESAVGQKHISEMSRESCAALVKAVYERFPELGLEPDQG